MRTRTVVFALALVPVATLADSYAGGALARPWATMIDVTGDWSIRFLWPGCACRPWRG